VWISAALRPYFPRSAELNTPVELNTKEKFMSNPALHHKITYIEFTTTDIERTRKFYSAVFGWSFQDWGPQYIGFEGAGIDGGFAKGDPQPPQDKSTPLVVLYSSDLKATEAAIVAAGGSIVVPTFEFPGGRRFHFSDGTGNILGVWSE
jgi:predicted enzyme related to lactoylglutathione lyase